MGPGKVKHRCVSRWGCKIGAMRQAVIAGLFVLCALACSAEPRWCTITGRGANDTLFYPPIARAARVSGVVLGRVIYTPTGKFVRFEYIFGPRLLSNMVSGQLERWTIQTHAEGDELCQTLVIAEFQLDIPGASEPSVEIHSESGSTLRVYTQAQTVCLCEPGGVIGPEPPLKHVWHTIKHMTHRVFGEHPKPWE